MKNYLFVYGTLLPDMAPPGLRNTIARLRPVSSGSMPGRLYDMGLYPAAIYDEAARGRVSGQVFELENDDAVLRELDEYEGYAPGLAVSSLFVRLQRPITLPDGTAVNCWVYLYNRNLGEARPIPGGDYSAWAARRQASSHRVACEN